MKIKKPLESVGWLSGAGYQTVIDEEARQAAKSAKEKPEGSSERTSSIEVKKTKVRAAAAKS